VLDAYIIEELERQRREKEERDRPSIQLPIPHDEPRKPLERDIDQDLPNGSPIVIELL